jgi:hypothetical protein
MSSRCRQFAINKSDPRYVPVYTPVSCPDPVNNDPKRNDAYCAPALCRSEPLSHSEYLRKLKANNGRAVSSAANLLQVGSGRYTTTIWTTSEAAGSCCNGNDSVLPAVPAVHPGGHALDSGHLTEMRGANAARGTVSKFDSVNKTEDITMLRRKGLAIAADNSFGAPAGSTRTTCDVCSLSGTTTVDPGTGCGCSS